MSLLKKMFRYLNHNVRHHQREYDAVIEAERKVVVVVHFNVFNVYRTCQFGECVTSPRDALLSCDGDGK